MKHNISVHMTGAICMTIATLFCASCSKDGYSDPSKDINYSVNNINFMGATLSVSSKNGQELYGGIMLLFPDQTYDNIAETFLNDAEPVIAGYNKPKEWNESKQDYDYEHVYGEGFYGIKLENGSFSGEIMNFATHDNGSGAREPRLIFPGAVYAVGLIAYSENTDYSKLTVDDVCVRYITLASPTAMNDRMCSVEQVASTTTTAKVSFSLKADITRFYYAILSESELSELKMSSYNYVLYHGACWDRDLFKAVGDIEGLELEKTMLSAGEKCVALGLGFTKSGAYCLVNCDAYAHEVQKSAGTLSFGTPSTEPLNENVTWINVPFTVSSDIVDVRYLVQSDDTISEQEIFNTLSQGSLWDYSSVVGMGGDLQSPIRFTCMNEDIANRILYAVGLDNEGKYTELQKIDFKNIVL